MKPTELKRYELDEMSDLPRLVDEKKGQWVLYSEVVRMFRQIDDELTKARLRAKELENLSVRASAKTKPIESDGAQLSEDDLKSEIECFKANLFFNKKTFATQAEAAGFGYERGVIDTQDRLTTKPAEMAELDENALDKAAKKDQKTCGLMPYTLDSVQWQKFCSFKQGARYMYKKLKEQR